MTKKGFTLIEMMVTVVIFSLIITTVTGIFISAIGAQRKALAYQELLNQTSYAMEYMSRSLRMAKKERDDPAFCLTGIGYGYGYNYEITRLGEGVKFINHLQDDDCQEFFRELDGVTETWRLKYKKGIGVSEETLDLTSDYLTVNFLKFSLSGESQADKLQPRVTFSLEIEGKEQTKTRIQTTISQRNLDVEY